jgi:hypothetical protein
MYVCMCIAATPSFGTLLTYVLKVPTHSTQVGTRGATVHQLWGSCGPQSTSPLPCALGCWLVIRTLGGLLPASLPLLPPPGLGLVWSGL